MNPDPHNGPPRHSPDVRRREALEQLTTDGVDLLVVGGGITGAGIARDAALRGLSVAIVDKGDWASGTSSKSAKLVHGGLRYLETFDLGLVMESTRERYRLRKRNPHVVWPIPFVMPVYDHDKHGLAKLGLGLWLYDLLSFLRAFKRHRRLGRDATVAEVPGLRVAGLRGAHKYYDCRTDDARLTWATVADAARHGATALNYVAYEGPSFDGDRVAAADLREARTGNLYRVRCKHIVYAAGHWTDRLAHAPGGGRLIRPTKGVHVVLPRARLRVDSALALTSVTDGRAMFAVPFEHTTYIGTTDTDYHGDLDDIQPTRADVDYLLETANYFFPDAELTVDDVRATWAGLRPLIREDGKTAYRTSREHEIYPDPRGITTIAGGKLTTYRAMAQELTDLVAKDLKRHHGIRAGRCRTHKVALDPALRAHPDLLRGPPDPLERALYRLHGSAARWIRRRMADFPLEQGKLCQDLPYVMAQVSWAVLGEQARTLEDALVRRIPIFYLGVDQGLSCGPQVARHMAALLDRDRAWVNAQLRDYERLVRASRAWRDAAPLADSS